MNARIAVLVAIAALALVAQPAGAATVQGCPDAGGNWSAPGSFSVVRDTTKKHQIYRPAALGSLGCSEHPVIIWGNGTGTSPQSYTELLSHWASHGFIVAAAKTAMAGDGKDMLRGIDYLTAQNATPGSPYAGLVDLDRIGASGHSQGGGGATSAAADPRVHTSVPIEGAPIGKPADIKGPVFYLGGQNDYIVPPASMIRSRYRKTTHVPAIYGVIAGEDHFNPLGEGGEFRAPATAWLRFWLMGDEQARGQFFGPACGYCGSPLYSEFERNALAQAIAGP